MNYQKIYDAIIYRAKNTTRYKHSYYEKHHVLPCCMGGRNGETILLTAREHFICHLLLPEIYPNNPEHGKLVYALWCMITRCTTKQQRYKITARTYSRLRTEFSRSRIGHAVSIETRKKMHDARVGTTHITSGETKAKISKTLTGRKRSIECCRNISKSKLGKRLTDEHKRKISEAETGRLQTPRQIEALKQYLDKIKMPVMCIETGVIYSSRTIASKDVGLDASTIWYLVKSGKRHRKSGLSFKYI